MPRPCVAAWPHGCMMCDGACRGCCGAVAHDACCSSHPCCHSVICAHGEMEDARAACACMQVLYEAEQQLPNGCRRNRNVPLSEKMIGAETWQQALKVIGAQRRPMNAHECMDAHR